jgi:hypothetical protein
MVASPFANAHENVLLARKRIDDYNLMGFSFSFSCFEFFLMDICHEKNVTNKKKEN